MSEAPKWVFDLLRYHNLNDIANKYNDNADDRADKSERKMPDHIPTCNHLGYWCIKVDGQTGEHALIGAQSYDMKQDARFHMLMLNIEAHGTYHSNVLLFDLQRMTVERFEPHGWDTEHPLQQACGFYRYYNAGVLDELVVNCITNSYPKLELRYLSPHPDYPIMPQTLTTNDSCRNEQPTYGPFKRRGADTSGDPFCGAWTLLYVWMRTTNPDVERSGIYNHLSGRTQVASLAKYLYLTPAAKLSVVGRWSADVISSFIVFEWAFRLRQRQWIPFEELETLE
jgi:hypothetical protein